MLQEFLKGAIKLSTQEILIAIKRLPPEEQKKLLAELEQGLGKEMLTEQSISEEEVQEILFAKGVIGNLPNLSDYTDKDDNFEPIEIEGEPLSETIIRERR